MLPLENTLPDSFYSTKKLLKAFDLGYEEIHACIMIAIYLEKTWNMQMYVVKVVLLVEKLMNELIRFIEEYLQKSCVIFQ